MLERGNPWSGVAALVQQKSHWLARVELLNEELVETLYPCHGWDIVAVMNGQGQLVEGYTGAVWLPGDTGRSVSATHHAGRGSDWTVCIHHNHWNVPDS